MWLIDWFLIDNNELDLNKKYTHFTWSRQNTAESTGSCSEWNGNESQGLNKHILIRKIWSIFHFSQLSFSHLAWKLRYQNIIYMNKKIVFFSTEKQKLILLIPLETILVSMCHVLEQFCCSCIHTKTEKNRSKLFEETTEVVKLLRPWSLSKCKCTDMHTWFSELCRCTPPCF